MKLSITRFVFVALIGVLATVGCQTQQQLVQSNQAIAIQTALSRAKFDMNCPSATGTVLSTNVSQPAVQGRFASAYGVQRFEYTIGVTGCGKRRTYVVVCPQGGTGCFAAPGPVIGASASPRGTRQKRCSTQLQGFND